MMERNRGRFDWLFPFPVVEIRAACVEKVVYHKDRHAYWSSEAEEIELKLRTDGIDIRERQVTGGNRFDVVLDGELSERLGEARNKRDHHERLRDEYLAYYAGLYNMDGNQTLSLNYDDIAWFGMNKVEVE